jgi:hypothetical protein
MGNLQVHRNLSGGLTMPVGVVYTLVLFFFSASGRTPPPLPAVRDSRSATPLIIHRRGTEPECALGTFLTYHVPLVVAEPALAYTKLEG